MTCFHQSTSFTIAVAEKYTPVPITHIRIRLWTHLLQPLKIIWAYVIIQLRLSCFDSRTSFKVRSRRFLFTSLLYNSMPGRVSSVLLSPNQPHTFLPGPSHSRPPASWFSISTIYLSPHLKNACFSRLVLFAFTSGHPSPYRPSRSTRLVEHTPCTLLTFPQSS
ncbi:hypothetical protein JAAARDRAFT_445733 [Jaapia argillacea MUCL 33604]|uniref:Uncharacterized protein n=1 Tax=Jaapia argillacea MUCL 33604 TaxID=933084 RepID=A0A067PGB2_9AGAM|nr:hypothetical protein JAAARDRAFT_445733 [Jaapia argillacea MUCL 33604]